MREQNATIGRNAEGNRMEFENAFLDLLQKMF